MTDTTTTEEKRAKGNRIIRNIYLYLVALIGIITLVFGCVGIINNVLQNYVFHVNDYTYIEPAYPGSRGGSCAQPYTDPTDKTGTKLIQPTTQEIQDCKDSQQKQNDQNRQNNIGREFSIAIAQILIGLPLWLFHWNTIQVEYRRKHEEEEKKSA